MSTPLDYTVKFEALSDQIAYKQLDWHQKQFVREIAFKHRLTYQEIRQAAQACRDLSIWGEEDLPTWWKEQVAATCLQGGQLKKQILKNLAAHLHDFKQGPVVYSPPDVGGQRERRPNPIVTERSDKQIWGMCPVASEKTVCCNLHTIDAVENCSFGCSYCSIQTFYQDRVVFDDKLAEKLKQISLEPDRFYHIGTGQSSDSLVWGNRNGILETLCQFASEHPNILLELKTKSDNVRDLLHLEVPANVVCSWSLNTPTIIENEEHYIASLDRRLNAARAVADKGIGVSFHFHPMICYEGWARDYTMAARRLTDMFHAEEVIFISFGSLTLTKPVLQEIRSLGQRSKVSQVEFVPDPNGKLTYPDEIKVSLFKTMYNVLTPWHEKVFIYLCMEKAAIWEETFGAVYENNEAFERDFGLQTMRKLPLDTPRQEASRTRGDLALDEKRCLSRPKSS